MDKQSKQTGRKALATIAAFVIITASAATAFAIPKDHPNSKRQTFPAVKAERPDALKPQIDVDVTVKVRVKASVSTAAIAKAADALSRKPKAPSLPTTPEASVRPLRLPEVHISGEGSVRVPTPERAPVRALSARPSEARASFCLHGHEQTR